MEGSVDPRHLVLGAVQASLTLFGAQTTASILLANGQGTAVDVRFAGGLIPFLGLRTTPADVVPLMSWSVALVVGFTVTAALWNLWRRRDNPSLVLGWASALAMSTVLIAMQWVRHLIDPPLVDLWILAQALAYVVAAACLFIAYRPSITSATEKSP